LTTIKRFSPSTVIFTIVSPYVNLFYLSLTIFKYDLFLMLAQLARRNTFYADSRSETTA
jgi:hypothetical protein